VPIRSLRQQAEALPPELELPLPAVPLGEVPFDPNEEDPDDGALVEPEVPELPDLPRFELPTLLLPEPSVLALPELPLIPELVEGELLEPLPDVMPDPALPVPEFIALLPEPLVLPGAQGWALLLSELPEDAPGLVVPAAPDPDSAAIAAEPIASNATDAVVSRNRFIRGTSFQCFAGNVLPIAAPCRTPAGAAPFQYSTLTRSGTGLSPQYVPSREFLLTSSSSSAAWLSACRRPQPC
jgi:hypothetical protein